MNRLYWGLPTSWIEPTYGPTHDEQAALVVAAGVRGTVVGIDVTYTAQPDPNAPDSMVPSS